MDIVLIILTWTNDSWWLTFSPGLNSPTTVEIKDIENPIMRHHEPRIEIDKALPSSIPLLWLGPQLILVTSGQVLASVILQAAVWSWIWTRLWFLLSLAEFGAGLEEFIQAEIAICGGFHLGFAEGKLLTWEPGWASKCHKYAGSKSFCRWGQYWCHVSNLAWSNPNWLLYSCVY